MQLDGDQRTMDALLAAMRQSVCWVRASDQRIGYADPKFAKLFGLPAITEATPVEVLSCAGFLANLPPPASAGTMAELGDVTCTREDGTSWVCQWRAVPLEVDGQPGFLLAAIDVTLQRQAEALQRESGARLAEIERLQELDRVKTQFINNAAHELKTPLTPIRVQTHLLGSSLSTGLDEDQKRSVHIITRSLDRLAHLVDDILQAARIQSHRLDVRLRAIDVNPVVLETVESFQAVAKDVGVDLEWRNCEPAFVQGDPKRLVQVVYNLLSNALKFTPAGGRVVVETSTSGTEAFVRVRDTGPGLTPDQIARLFRPFSQVHDTMQDTRAGTGLGLFISQGIIADHGGRLWAESSGPGRGSCFSFALPLATAPQPTQEADVSPEVVTFKGSKVVDREKAQRLRELI